MSAFRDLTGQRFGRLVAIYPTDKRKNKFVIWLCWCDCGNLVYVGSNLLTTGNTKSCGCLWKEIMAERSFKHGDAVRGKAARLYVVWAAIKRRCLKQEDKDYKYYGGKEISVCNEWRDSYTAFRDWALANGYKEGLTIDRINSKGNYEPSNCHWITRAENVKKSNIERKGIKYKVKKKTLDVSKQLP